MNKQSKWRVVPTDPALLYIFENELKVTPILAKLLINRGISSLDEARFFLEGKLSEMHDPFLMTDMDKAVTRIKNALEKREKILVYGDYDADGTTATALLVKVLTCMGGQVGYYIPDRMDEGYGLHMDALCWAADEGYGLVVTVDCGVSALEVIAQNNLEKGPDIIVTDHHEPLEQLPDAVAVLNPKRIDCQYPFKELAGVGVALKLAQALFIDCGQGEDSWQGYLDLVCLGTVADIVPLHGENRIIVKYGLPALVNTDSPGLKSLMKVSGVSPEQLGTREIGFALAPRINAAGRVGDATKSVKLLITDDHQEALELASLLHRNNQERQRIESLVLAEAMGMLDAEPDLAEQHVIVLASETWHSGVVGIVASRLVDRYYRPVILIAIEDGEGKGSGRSIPGFHLYESVSRCGDLLTRFGGHAQAVGLSIPADNVDLLRSTLNAYVEKNVDKDTFIPGINFDAEVSLTDINEMLIQEIHQLAPFGHCNPDPLLVCPEATLLSCREIGKNGGHLKLLVRENGAVLDGIGFRMASCLDEVAAASEVDLAFFPSINEWQGRRNLQLVVKDIRPSGDGLKTELLQFPDYVYLNNVPGFNEAENSLRSMGPLAFVPEWVVAVLHRYRQCSSFFSYPGSYLENYPVKTLSLEKQNSSWLHMLEEQGISCKGSYLKYLYSEEKGSDLILVDSAAKAVETAVFLNRSGVPAGFIHSGSNQQTIHDLMNWFKAGEAVMVSTYMTWNDLSLTPDRVILMQPPYNSESLEILKSNGTECIRLFSKSELKTALDMLEALAGGREILGELYNLFRCQRGGIILPEEMVESLHQAGLSQAGIHTLAYGLAVFADLGLINLNLQRNMYYIEYNSVKGKKELNDSPVFSAAQNISEVIEKWWNIE